MFGLNLLLMKFMVLMIETIRKVQTMTTDTIEILTITKLKDLKSYNTKILLAKYNELAERPIKAVKTSRKEFCKRLLSLILEKNNKARSRAASSDKDKTKNKDSKPKTTDESKTVSISTDSIGEYKELDRAFKFYNERLFKGALPDTIISLRGRKSCNGFFRAQSFKSRENEEVEPDEIAMNPEHFSRSIEEILSTLVHEMVHSWQFHCGKKKKVTKYHNKEWAEQMELVGLVPSVTGAEGGKKTGQSMTHYIEEGGIFETVTAELLKSGLNLKWVRLQNLTKTKKSKVKYTCPDCDQNAWAKPDAVLRCGLCCDDMGEAVLMKSEE